MSDQDWYEVNDSYELDPRLSGDALPVGRLPLSEVRLMDDARYPWLVLIPQRAGMVEILDLSDGEQLQLYDEVRVCARVLQERYRPDKLNIAALGNVVPQLHVHVIARFERDDAWPRPVWGAHAAKRYPNGEAGDLTTALARAIPGLRHGG